jgi:DNA anti-recombination protein RmuC
VSWIETVGIVHVFAFGVACGGVLVDLRGQKRETARVEQSSKDRDAEIVRESKERDAAIERNARERITDGDTPRDERLDKLEERVEKMDERIGEKFDSFSTEMRRGLGELTVQVARLAKASNPRFPAQGGE